MITQLKLCRSDERHDQWFRATKLLLCIVCIILGTGCATTSEPFRFYDGPPRSEADISVLRGALPLILCKVDGKPGPDTLFRGLAFSPVTLKTYGYRSFVVELEPGLHTFEFDFYISDGRTTSRATTFPMSSLVMERGATYEITGSQSRSGLETLIRRIK